MAQSTPENPTEGVPRPLPRGGRPSRARDTRPRFQPIDAGWIALLAALYAALNYPVWGRQHIGLYCMCAGAGTVALTYLLGWRAAGQPAGVIAGLLLATSSAFGGMSLDTLGVTIFAMVTIAALFAFIAGSSLAALVLAVVAVMLRPDSLLLGLMLLTLSLVQHRLRAALGAALFLVPAIGIWLYLLITGQGPGYAHPFGVNLDILAWIVAPATVFLSWFLLPFLGEMGDPVRRARWLPVAWWTGLYLLLETCVTIDRAGGISAVLVPFIPLWFVLVGTGIARLLPMMTGDIPIPNLRYVVATLAVVALIGTRARMEWLRPQSRALPPVTSTVPAPAPVAAPAQNQPLVYGPQKPPVLLKRLPKRSPAIKPLALPKSAKPTVPLYTVKNGHLVKRTKWAIQWDLTHPKQ